MTLRHSDKMEFKAVSTGRGRVIKLSVSLDVSGLQHGVVRSQSVLGIKGKKGERALAFAAGVLILRESVQDAQGSGSE